MDCTTSSRKFPVVHRTTCLGLGRLHQSATGVKRGASRKQIPISSDPVHTPSFPGYSGSLTYYNPYSGDSVRSREHWLNYLSNASLAKYTADSVGCFLERTSHQQLKALDNATRSINGTLAHGFAGVQGGLVAVADEVRGLAVQQAQGNRLLALANAQLGELN